jgi:phospho-N-acetylmuramoyl-pentapeptide-transferase
MAILIAKPLIGFLKNIKSLQSFRELGPQSHISEKSGTPTMGAWIFLIPIFILGLILYYQSQLQIVILALTAMLIGALMGGVDDMMKIIKSNYRGINSISKLAIQFLASSLVVYFSGRYLFADVSTLPEFLHPFLLAWEFVWAFLVIAGASNAINLSDGLDGLAAGLVALAFLGLIPLLWIKGDFSAISFCLIIIASLFGFLIFNFKPAKVFMGDTGSLALGMGLGALAYVADLELYLLVLAFVPVLETLSVILQVASAKFSRKYLGKDWRIFRMAPLHHHFELGGMNEVVVVILFWLSQAAITVGFMTLRVF